MGIPTNHPAVRQAYEKGLVSGAVVGGDESRSKEGGTGIVLPVPPSTNNLFLNTKGGRIKTPEYRQWSELASYRLLGVSPIAAYPVFVKLVCEEKVNLRRDSDNMIKALLDACVAAGILAGDSLAHVCGVMFLYRPRPDGSGVSVHFSADMPA